jgi:hypothetical protein
MASTIHENTTGAAGDMPAQLFEVGKEQSASMIKLHKELLDAYEEASRAWLSRVRSEADLWSDLAAKLTKSRSVPEGLEAFRDYASRRTQMATEDGQRVFEDSQKIIGAITKSLSNGWPAAT